VPSLSNVGNRQIWTEIGSWGAAILISTCISRLKMSIHRDMLGSSITLIALGEEVLGDANGDDAISLGGDGQ
jgi:hypothetical protein